jgi:hypothetical protein
MAPDRDTAQMILHEGDRQMHGVTRLWMNGVLDAATAAIEHVGDTSMRARYLEIRDDELRARARTRSGFHVPHARDTVDAWWRYPHTA